MQTQRGLYSILAYKFLQNKLVGSNEVPGLVAHAMMALARSSAQLWFGYSRSDNFKLIDVVYFLFGWVISFRFGRMSRIR